MLTIVVLNKDEEKNVSLHTQQIQEIYCYGSLKSCRRVGSCSCNQCGTRFRNHHTELHPGAI